MWGSMGGNIRGGKEEEGGDETGAKVGGDTELERSLSGVTLPDRWRKGSGDTCRERKLSSSLKLLASLMSGLVSGLLQEWDRMKSIPKLSRLFVERSMVCITISVVDTSGGIMMSSCTRSRSRCPPGHDSADFDRPKGGSR